MLSRLAADTGRSSVLGVRQQVQFRGRPMPYLVSKLTAPKTPGVYRLDFVGSEASHKTSEEAAGWIVVPGAGSWADPRKSGDNALLLFTKMNFGGKSIRQYFRNVLEYRSYRKDPTTYPQVSPQIQRHSS